MINVLLFVTACSSTDSMQTNDSFDENKLETFEVENNEAEVTDGDYVFRLISEKEVYQVGEKVDMYGELTYVGDKEEVEIVHSTNLFIFPMLEKVREHEISGGTTEEAVETTLKRNEPYIENYAKNGVGYAGEDPQSYQSFIENFMNRGDFPAGYYEVQGEASFSVNGEPIEMEAVIDFKVVKEN